MINNYENSSDQPVSVEQFQSINLLDHIHNLILDEANEINENKILDIIIEVLRLIDYNLDQDISNELITLFYSCFTRLSNNLPINIINKILETATKNAIHIILTASISNQLKAKKNKLDISLFISFIEGTFRQISNQINKSNDDKFVIFDHEIPLQFEENLVVDMLLLVKLKESILNRFFPYIVSHKNISKEKLTILYQKILANGLRSIVPNLILNNEIEFIWAQNKNLTTLLSELSDEQFQNIWPKIESLISNDKMSHDALLAIIKRCNKLNIKFKFMDYLIKSLQPSCIDIAEPFLEHLAKYNVVIPMEIASEIDDFPNPLVALKVMPNIEMIPSYIIKRILLESDDFSIYERVFNSQIELPKKVLSSDQFWTHILSIVGSSKEECSNKFTQKMSDVFKKFVSENNVFGIFNQMIMNNFPTNDNENIFLLNLLNSFEPNYKENYHKNSKELLQNVVNSKIIPYASFWKLFDFNQIKDVFKNTISNPILMYAYEYSDLDLQFKRSFLKKLIISAQLNSTDEEIILNFINSNNIEENWYKMNEKTLSFIMSAKLFSNSSKDITISGRTRNSILPFYAVSFISNTTNDLVIFDSSNVVDAIQDACTQIESPLMITSVNIIFTNFIKLCDNIESNYNEVAIKMLNVIIHQIVNGTYKADIILVLTLIFKLSYKSIHNKFYIDNGVDFFVFMIKNMDQIKNFNQLQNIKINLNVFDKVKLEDAIVYIIQNSQSSKYVINAIRLIENYCHNSLPLRFNIFQNFIKVFQESVENKKWDDVILIGKILNIDMLKDQMQPLYEKSVPIQIKEIILNRNLYNINNIVLNILNQSNPEDDILCCENIFKILMNEESIAVDYFTILFEKISYMQSFKIKSILELYLDEYQSYKCHFIKSLIRCFYYNSISKELIRKSVFQSISLPLSNTGTALIKILFEKIKEKPDNYQAFYCLLNIASSFPFLFIENYQQVFILVLQAFEYYSLYYTVENGEVTEETINKTKTAFTAFVFLLSILVSVTIINSFIPWLFENILSFSDAQIIPFVYIMISLLTTKKINKITLAISIKYNFLGIFYTLLNRNVADNLKFCYRNSIYNLLNTYYDLLINLSNEKIILVDELSKIENPFIVQFDNFSTVPTIKMKIFIEYKYDNDLSIKINKYIEKITEIKAFSIDKIQSDSYEIKNVPDVSFDLFIINFNKFYKHIKSDDEEVGMFNPLFDDKVYIHRYLRKQPAWIFKWIIKKEYFHPYPEQITVLADVISNLETIEKSAKNEKDDRSISDINVNDYFINEFQRNDLFKYLINEASICDDKSFQIISALIMKITMNSFSLISFLEIINSNLHKNCTIETLNRNVNILLTISDLCQFKDDFNESYCYNLIQTVLNYKFRKSSILLSNTAKIICKSNQNNFNKTNIVHLIGFMFLLDEQQIIPDALELCNLVEFQDLNCIEKIINHAYSKAINSETPSLFIIKCFFDKIPLLFKNKTISIVFRFCQLKDKYLSNPKEETFDLMCLILNLLTPNKEDIQQICNEIDFSPSIPIKNNKKNKCVLNQPSFILKRNYKCFYNQYEVLREIVCKHINNSEILIPKLKCIQNFPELMNFNLRLSYFNQKMSSKINKKEKIVLKIDRSNVLSSSFNELQMLDSIDWLKGFKISFVGEKGIDEGGLTNEWFSLIIKEILNPRNNLFILTENKSYQPNPFFNSDTNIDHFKLIGMIFARLLIQGQCVNAHLSKSFYRQILHQYIKFDDLKDYDEEIYGSLQNLLNIDVDFLDLNFTIDVNENSKNKTILLCENGDDISVTNENIKEYVSLYTNYHLKKSIINQIDSFKEGFNSLIQSDEIGIFTPDELDLIICGKQTIDVNDLRKYTKYEFPYHEKHKVILMFFNVISKWDNEKLSKFLMFLTGSSQVPINGFIEYQNRNKPIRIAAGGDKNHLCVAHTCFNVLDLPQYETEEEMNNKLSRSIEECAFGIK